MGAGAGVGLAVGVGGGGTGLGVATGEGVGEGVVAAIMSAPVSFAVRPDPSVTMTSQAPVGALSSIRNRAWALSTLLTTSVPFIRLAPDSIWSCFTSLRLLPVTVSQTAAPPPRVTGFGDTLCGLGGPEMPAAAACASPTALVAK